MADTAKDKQSNGGKSGAERALEPVHVLEAPELSLSHTHTHTYHFFLLTAQKMHTPLATINTATIAIIAAPTKK